MYPLQSRQRTIAGVEHPGQRLWQKPHPGLVPKLRLGCDYPRSSSFVRPHRSNQQRALLTWRFGLAESHPPGQSRALRILVPKPEARNQFKMSYILCISGRNRTLQPFEYIELQVLTRAFGLHVKFFQMVAGGFHHL